MKIWRPDRLSSVLVHLRPQPVGAVGVSYTYADGAREAHAVSTDDWPVIRKLRDAGKLSYADDEVREGMDEIARRGLDR